MSFWHTSCAITIYTERTHTYTYIYAYTIYIYTYITHIISIDIFITWAYGCLADMQIVHPWHLDISFIFIGAWESNVWWKRGNPFCVNLYSYSRLRIVLIGRFREVMHIRVSLSIWYSKSIASFNWVLCEGRFLDVIDVIQGMDDVS